jgi:Arc/MetJ family transcription regulator
VNYVGRKRARLRLDSELYDHLRAQVLRRDGGDANRAAVCPTLRFTTDSFAANPDPIPRKT